MPRRFLLIRDLDDVGVSGTGVVAEGVLSSTGKVVLFWLTHYKSVGVYDSIEDCSAIHCHGGLTYIQWIDAEVLGGL